MSLKLKLDENFSPALVDLFQNAGIDTHTVFSENLSGASDQVIYETILSEERILLTFDTDFCNILRFPPDESAGIIVVRPKRPISLADVYSFAFKILDLLAENNPKGCLWVLESDKLRIRGSK
jgi:hypothetical protein